MPSVIEAMSRADNDGEVPFRAIQVIGAGSKDR
jgi:hypothetical protein